eukprot:Rhum_TRINITY_DN9907_c0_g1::Rhum_TRINITY_DN9907_c0_g1_i1::g.35892::m.35892
MCRTLPAASTTPAVCTVSRHVPCTLSISWCASSAWNTGCFDTARTTSPLCTPALWAAEPWRIAATRVPSSDNPCVGSSGSVTRLMYLALAAARTFATSIGRSPHGSQKETGTRNASSSATTGPVTTPVTPLSPTHSSDVSPCTSTSVPSRNMYARPLCSSAADAGDAAWCGDASGPAVCGVAMFSRSSETEPHGAAKATGTRPSSSMLPTTDPMWSLSGRQSDDARPTAHTGEPGATFTFVPRRLRRGRVIDSSCAVATRASSASRQSNTPWRPFHPPHSSPSRPSIRTMSYKRIGHLHVCLPRAAWNQTHHPYSGAARPPAAAAAAA